MTVEMLLILYKYLKSFFTGVLTITVELFRKVMIRTIRLDVIIFVFLVFFVL